MGVLEFSDSITTPVPAAKLFNGFFVESHTLLPKAAPHAVKSVELLEGSGGVGSIKQVNFADGLPAKYLKYKVDVLDAANLSYADTVIEGGPLSEKVEKVTHEVKFVGNPDGGCTSTLVVKLYPKAGAEISEEEIKAGKEGAQGLFRALEAYLLAN